jgi:hypothetical protein
MMKLRSDMLFHTMAPQARHVMAFTEVCTLAACEAERRRGRVPLHIEFLLIELPAELSARLTIARAESSREVQPNFGISIV